MNVDALFLCNVLLPSCFALDVFVTSHFIFDCRPNIMKTHWETSSISNFIWFPIKYRKRIIQHPLRIFVMIQFYLSSDQIWCKINLNIYKYTHNRYEFNLNIYITDVNSVWIYITDSLLLKYGINIMALYIRGSEFHICIINDEKRNLI